MRRLFLLIAFGMSAAFCRAEDWSLQIVPLTGQSLPSVIHVGATTAVFQVLLKNISGKPLLIWKQWCSYGYFNLRYQVTRSNGQKFVLRRMGGSWTRNFPDGAYVDMGATYPLGGAFDPGNSNSGWGSFPPDWRDGETVRLQAVYENERDPRDLKMFQSMEEKQRAAIFSHPAIDPKLKDRELALAGDQFAQYSQAWVGKVISPAIVVTMDQKSSPSSH